MENTRDELRKEISDIVSKCIKTARSILGEDVPIPADHLRNKVYGLRKKYETLSRSGAAGFGSIVKRELTFLMKEKGYVPRHDNKAQRTYYYPVSN